MPFRPRLAPTLRAVGASAPTGRRWLLAGVLAGGLLALLAFAPAAWLAQTVASASHEHLLLTETEGTVWQGSALPVLSGGPGSRDASVLPSRVHWSLRPAWGGLQLSLRQACCLEGLVLIDWSPGWQQQTLSLRSPAHGTVGHWPAAWLEGLGAPLNTLRLGGELQLSAQDLRLEGRQGQWQLSGQAQLDLLQTSSRLSSLEPLGSYRLHLQQSQPDAPVQLTLNTLEGVLRLTGKGQLTPRGLLFRAEAQAAPGSEAALNNLLNIMGRRDGALSRISIG